jgi:hypothetical protein
MEMLHYVCGGKVEPIVGFEGCYDDNYGRCTSCGTEGELIVKDTDQVQKLTFVSIEPIVSRYDIPNQDPD